MNLNSRGARRTLAIVCSTAVVAAGASFFAVAPASAATQYHVKSALATTGGTTVNTLTLGANVVAVATTGAAHADNGDGVAGTAGDNEFSVTAGSATLVSANTHLDLTLDVGDLVVGTGVPAGTTIVSVETTGSATMSKPATSTYADVLLHRALRKTLDNELLQPAYALRMTSAVASPVYMKLLTAPSSSTVMYVDDLGSTASPTGGGGGDNLFAMTTGGSDTTAAASYYAGSQVHRLANPNDRIYLAPGAVGSYTVEFFEDLDNSGTLTDGDNASSVVSVNAKSPGGTWMPAVTGPSTLSEGHTIPVTVDLSALTLSDARGSSAIGSGLSALIGVEYDNLTGTHLGANGDPLAAAVAIGATTYAGSTLTRTGAASATHTGTERATARFDIPGTGLDGADQSLGTVDTVITHNVISALSGVLQVDRTGEVSTDPSLTQTDIKGGVNTATFRTTATGAVTGDPVFFTLSPALGTNSRSVDCSSSYTDLTADGTLLASYGNGVKIYSALTVGTVASLTIRSSDTLGDCPSYVVAARSNGVSAASRTVQYVAPAPADFAATNSSAELLPAVGTASVTLKGTLTDQFGVSVPPLSSATQQATLTVGSTTVSVPAVSGAFSYTYTPSPAPTSPTTTPFTWTYSTFSDSGTITWSSTASAGTVSLNTPVNNAASVTLSSSGTVAPGQPSPSTFGDPSGKVTGMVTDASGAVLPYKKVTLSGDPGVLFSSAAGGSAALTSTIDVVTNASGQFNTAYAFFTKAGATKIVATADGKSATANLTVADSADGYIVSVNDAFGTPGAISVTGKVVDIFGNPVNGRKVDLAVTPAGAGTLTAPTVTTTTDGSFTGTFTANAGAKGDFTVTATMENAGNTAALTANPVPSTTWATTAAVKDLPDGQYKDTSKLTVGPIILTGPASRQGEGFVRLTGVANPNAPVTIKGRTAGSTAGLVDVDTVTADSNGDFTANEYITGTTTFVAVSGGQFSPSVTVSVMPVWVNKPTASKITALVPRALGNGRLTLTVVGNGNGGTTVTVFRLAGKKWVKVTAVKARSNGVQVIAIRASKGNYTFRIAYAVPGNATVYRNTTLRVK